MHLVGFTRGIRIYHVARSSECQINCFNLIFGLSLFRRRSQ